MPNKQKRWGKVPLSIFVDLFWALEVGHQEGRLKWTRHIFFQAGLNGSSHETRNEVNGFSMSPQILESKRKKNNLSIKQNSQLFMYIISLQFQ